MASETQSIFIWSDRGLPRGGSCYTMYHETFAHALVCPWDSYLYTSCAQFYGSDASVEFGSSERHVCEYYWKRW